MKILYEVENFCKMCGEISKNFENITRNFQENFDRKTWIILIKLEKLRKVYIKKFW